MERRSRYVSIIFPYVFPETAVALCAAQPSELARPFILRLTSAMKGRAVFFLLGLCTMGACALGYYSAPVSQAPIRATASRSGVEQPVAFSGSAVQLPEPASAPRATSAPAPTGKALPEDKPSASDAKRKVEAALTSAAIAAIIVQASRAQYHAGGKPCACPDDATRNDRACGGRSAYSRPGGASPLLLSERYDNGDD